MLSNFIRQLARLVVLSAFVLPALSFAQTGGQANAAPVLTPEVRAEILTGVKDILEKRAFVPGLDFTKWDAMVLEKKEVLDKAETETAFAGEVNRMLRSFGISHVGLQTPRNANFRRTGVTTGLGMGAQFSDGAMVVQSVAVGSPAEKAGVKVGDKIVEINGGKVTAESRLQNAPNEALSIKVMRGTEELTMKIEAGEYVVVRKDQLTWPSEGIAMIRINSFSRGYERTELNNMMKEAQEKGAKSVIVDLRNNGGGAVNNLAHLMGLFIDPNLPVGTFVNRSMMTAYLKEKTLETATVKEVASWGAQKYRPTAPSVPRFDGTMAVLVNRGSASASEIFAAAIKEVRNSFVVGANTRGAVLASTYGRLAGGFEIQYPVSDYVTIKGQRLEGDPVVPTHPVEVPRGAQTEDVVVKAAVTALNAINTFLY